MASLQNALNANLMHMAFSVSIESVGITASGGQKEFSKTRHIQLKINVEVDVLLQNAINTTDVFEQSATYPVARASVTCDKPASAGAARGKHRDYKLSLCKMSMSEFKVQCFRVVAL